jgi:uncharacterized membrane protein YhaH (DUF805 family)
MNVSKLKWFASEYRNVITVISLLVVVVINIVFAAYAFGQLKETMADSKLFQTDQKIINQQFLSGLATVTSNQAVLSKRLDDWEFEHGQLMNLHHIPPAKWQHRIPYE